MKKYYYMILLLTMSILLVSTIQVQYGNPINLNYVNYYLEHGVRDTGAVNLVASVYLDYRTYDTLMETVILITAVVGVLFFLSKEK